MEPGEFGFTRAGLLRGVTASLPIAFGVFVYGLVFGMLAEQAGLALWSALMMSATVFAGASQFVVMDMWRDPLPVWAIATATLAVNLRHVLMGAALQPWFSKLRPWQAYGSLFFMNDESWALTLAQYGKGTRDSMNGAFLMGSGLAVYVAWLAATWLGRSLAASIGDPAAWGIDFAFTAVFVALIAGMYAKRSDLGVWAVAGAAALVSEALLPGKWYIIIGGVAGGVAGMFQGGRDGR
jgi:4-azaleucine resistance transporter AzlC